MEEEIEDLIGTIKYTDSQNSNLYSCDFTDTSSDWQNSSGKDTYVIAYDSEDSDTTYDIGRSSSAINVYERAFPKPQHDVIIQCEARKANKAASTSLHTISLIEETFTQTSRTILELADTERSRNSLETQTSFMSISENKKVEYTIQYSGDVKLAQNEIMEQFNRMRSKDDNSYENETSKFYLKEIENRELDDGDSESGSNEILKILDSKEDLSYSKEVFDDSPKTDSDFEEDSLMDYDLRDRASPKDCNSETSEVPKSIDNDVEELYKKLSETVLQTPERSDDLVLKRCGTLTPLTEESTVKKDSLIDITPNINALCKSVNNACKNYEILDKLQNYGINLEIKTGADPSVTVTEQKGFKLPPIQKQMSCPNSQNLNLLFTMNTSKSLNKAETIQCFNEENENKYETWLLDKMEKAAGEHTMISPRHVTENKKANSFQLPPIEGELRSSNSQRNSARDEPSPEEIQQKISINGHIRELKTGSAGKAKGPWTRFQCYSRPRSPGSRSVSPDSSTSPTDAAERGCDSLCGELLRRLRSSNWLEVADTLDDVPRSLEKFWCVISEQRTADLIRQVSVHIESPRTQVARSACNTLGAVLKNTNYTKKPEFYEAVSTLLVKAGSFNRAVRRAANVALDEVVCGVELSKAVAALCVHGVGHKSPLVRCASARLLVVCTAIAGGGRELLRARPGSTATARRQVLQAMAAMLEDKNTDVRKFAERLYAMLRPLPSFEAYFLSDVDVELATRQMKRFDLLLKTR